LEALESRTLLTAGMLDTSFGAGGVVTNSTTFNGQPQVAALPDGGVIEAGLSTDYPHVAVARYNADGTPVTTFGNNGVLVLPNISIFGTNGEDPRSLALWYNPTNHADVRIVLAGSHGSDEVVVRLNLNGTLDTSFDSDGMQIIDFGDLRQVPGYNYLDYFVDMATSVAVSADGKITVAGYADSTSQLHPVQVARLNSNGSLDPNFGSGGKVIFNDNSTHVYIEPTFLALQPDGGVILTRATHEQGTGSDSDAVVMHLNANGTLDSNFRKIINFSHAGDFRPQGVAVQWDGKIVVVGSAISLDAQRIGGGVVRLNADGSYDTSFNGNGKQWIDFGGYYFVSGFAIDGDGAIVLGGFLNYRTGSESSTTILQSAVARLKADGTLDANFGVGGKATFGISNHSLLTGLTIDFDDRIVVTGNAFDTNFNYTGGFVARVDGYGLSANPYAVSVLGTAGNDTITVDQVSGTGALRVTVNGVSTDYAANSGEVFIAGLGGDDTITVNASLASGLLIDGGDGADTTAVNLGNLSGTVLVLDDGVNSGTGDSLIVNGTASNDTIFKAQGSVQWRPSGSSGPILEAVTFSGMEHVTLNGAAGNDTFHDPGQDTTILGGAGDDTIYIDGTTGNGVIVDGGDGSDTYIVSTGALGGPVAIADTGATGTDTLSVQGTTGDDTIAVISSGLIVNGATITVGAGLESLAVNGGGGNDSFTVLGALAAPLVFNNDQNGDFTVFGTPGNDSIIINAGGQGPGVTVKVNGTSLGTFKPTGRIIVYGGAGDDDIQVAGSVGIPVWLYGDDGNDRLNGGNGGCVLEGGAGDDLLVGGNGRDLLIGDGGADRMIGNGGDDILIGGTTAFDDVDAGLVAIMAEWNRTDIDVATRVAHLTDQTNSVGFLSRLNGNYFLIQDVTVFNDSSQDTLTGSAGSDWFFAGTADKITELSDADKAFIFI
jgi:uncharacterized delta-60 repeat protein